MEKYEQIVIDVVTSLLPRKYTHAVTLDSALIEDLSFDSVQIVKLATRLEEKTRLNILESNIDFTTIRTIRDIVNAVKEDSSRKK